MYWINKFGELIGGIGKVIAIVTDWSAPVMLTRIWCLFELNAAIDTGAELRFVATAAERMDLALNLHEKFKTCDAVVSRIEVRDCDAKRPHEIQDKVIFLGKLHGMEDAVNAKLRKEMQRWLAESAKKVLWRTSPHRDPMGEEELEVEAAAIGEGSGSLCCASGAKRTRFLENWPRLPALLRPLGLLPMLVALGLAAKGKSMMKPGMMKPENPYSIAVSGCFLAMLALDFLAKPLLKHQTDRQLRQPPVLGAWMGRHSFAALRVAALLGFVGFPLILLLLGAGLPSPSAVILGLFMGYIFEVMVEQLLGAAVNAAATRAELAVKVGWLQLKLCEAHGRPFETDAFETDTLGLTEALLRDAHRDVQHIVGVDDALRSYIAVPGLIRCLCELDKATEVAEVAGMVEAAEKRHAGNRCTLQLGKPGVCRALSSLLVGRIDDWKYGGPLLRARIAVARRSPDAEVLALLTELGQTELGKQHPLDENEPEWADFLARMAPGGDGTVESRAIWQALPPLMRSRGTNALSPWVKYTHEDRSYYKRHDPLEITLFEPVEGVRQEAEIGMPGLVMLGESRWEKLPGMAWGAKKWESEYAELRGPGCWTPTQHRKYVYQTRAKKIGWVLFFTALIALICSLYVYVDCGEHGEWGFGSCSCVGSFVGNRCGSECHCGGTAANNATSVGSCGGASCSTCSDGFVGEYCQLAPAYNISGAASGQYNGRYERLAAAFCYGQPVYQLGGRGGYVLYLTSTSSCQSCTPGWEVGTSDKATTCDNSGPSTTRALNSWGGGGSCPESPDGGGCVGKWRERIPGQGCGRDDWCTAPSLVVTPISAARSDNNLALPACVDTCRALRTSAASANNGICEERGLPGAACHTDQSCDCADTTDGTDCATLRPCE